MSGRGRCASMSEWEIDEMEHYKRCGWSNYELACYYGVSDRTIRRILRMRGELGEKAKPVQQPG